MADMLSCKCGHSPFDHSDDTGCDARGCTCSKGFEDVASDVFNEMDERNDRLQAMVDRMASTGAMMALLVSPLRKLCWAIEKLPASHEQTEAIILASDILREVVSIVTGEEGKNAVAPMGTIMAVYRKARIELETE